MTSAIITHAHSSQVLFNEVFLATELAAASLFCAFVLFNLMSGAAGVTHKAVCYLATTMGRNTTQRC